VAFVGSVIAQLDYAGGLVGSISNFNDYPSTIRNSSVSGGSISGSGNVGGVVGFVRNADIASVSNSSNVSGIDDLVGGLAGFARDTRFHQVANHGAVEGDDEVGGIIGGANTVSVTDATVGTQSAKVAITGVDSVGGFVGLINGNATIADPSFTGTIDARSEAGGLVGRIEPDSDAAVVISDATVEVNLTTGQGYAGGLLGYAGDGGNLGSQAAVVTIVRSSATGTVTAATDSAGGLVGEIFGGLIFGSDADVDVTGSARVGGLVGSLHAGAALSNSFALGSVAGDRRVGGLVGNAVTNSTISSSFAAGPVVGTGTGDRFGGLVGNLGEATVSASYASGAVSGTDAVGGLIGMTSHNNSNIMDVYATGSVTGSGGKVGGLIGYADRSGSLARGYAIGGVSGGTDVGGLIGSAASDFSVTDSFWDTTSSGQSQSAGGTGLATAAMRSFDTFADVWAIVATATPSQFADVSGAGRLIWVLCDDPNPANGTPRLAWESVRATCGVVQEARDATLFVSISDGLSLLRNVPFSVVISLVDDDGEAVAATSDIPFTLSASGGSEPLGQLRFAGGGDANPTATLATGESSVTVTNLIFTGISNPTGGRDITLTVSADGLTSATVAVSVRDTSLSVTLDPPVIPPDGVSTSILTVTLRDTAGVGVPGSAITIATDLGTLLDLEGNELASPVVLTTNAQGSAALRVRSTATPGLATLTVSCPGACTRTASLLFGSTEVTVPSELFAIAGNRKIWLLFDASSGVVLKYQYRLTLDEAELEGADWIDVPADAEQPYLITEVANDVAVFVQVRAVDVDGATLPSNTASVTPRVIAEPAADLGVTGREGVDELTPVAGKATLTVPFTFRNSGSAPLANVWLQESDLISGGRILALSAERGTLTRYGERWFWRGLNLAPNESVSGSITVEVEE